LRKICARKAGIKAVRLEVGRETRARQSLYRAAGFKKDERNLMTKWLRSNDKTPHVRVIPRPQGGRKKG